MLGSTVGMFLLTILMIVFCVFVIKWMLKLLAELFSNVLVKAISVFLLFYFDSIAFGEFEVSGDVSYLLMIGLSIIFAIVILSVQARPQKAGGGQSAPSGHVVTKTPVPSKNVCPKCGCEYQFVQPRVVPTGEYNDYDGKGYWESYTEDGMTKTRWIQPRRHDPVYKQIGGYYECPVCKRRR